MKIYTKSGDKGKTSLIGGKRIDKDELQVEAYGSVDELNSNLGLLVEYLTQKNDKEFILEIQNKLFIIGSQLAVDTKYSNNLVLPSLNKNRIMNIENEFDLIESQVSKMTNFIIPGGSKIISICHICRSVCRRAERRVVSLSKQSKIDSLIIIFLNRFSDYLFVLSRKIANDTGIDEILWIAK
ncbi:MAG: cob(I)yrinic acid a,c-diamide adenosyltransferase [Flavobacteriaceae bacterium]|nr:cob(I)yrinic acid a,c-diamide adenosyltransferase [Flavobacteriaceae bacterium]